MFTYLPQKRTLADSQNAQKKICWKKTGDENNMSWDKK